MHNYRILAGLGSRWLLCASFIALVPGAFFVAVISKVRFLKTVVSDMGESSGDRLAAEGNEQNEEIAFQGR